MSKKSYKLILFAIGIIVVGMIIIIIGAEDYSNNNQVAPNQYEFADNDENEIKQREVSMDYDIVASRTRADPIYYVGVDNCKICHSEKEEGWRNTSHGKDFKPGGIYPPVNNRADDLNLTGSCAFCHVVGMGDSESGGFDPNEWWSNDTATTDQSVGNIDLIGIQCEACHGPGSFHVEYQTGRYCADCKMDGEDEETHDMVVSPNELKGNPSVEESCYANGESYCHSSGSHDKYTPWKASMHSNQDQLKAEVVGEEPHGLNSYCARCKSPSQYDPEISLDNAEEYDADEWHGIGCADCHDPHSNEFEYQLRTPIEDSCTICHTNEKAEPEPGSEPHHTQKEAYGGYMGIGVEGSKGMAGVTCVDCHMWGTPSVGHGYYVSDAINIEKHETHSFEPTTQACADCHSDLMFRLPEHERPNNNTGGNEELWNEWDEWGEEWNETVEMWESVIEDWKSDYERIFKNVEANWEAAGIAFTSAKENGTIGEDTLTKAQALLDDAEWNIGLSNDGSHGVHNNDFFADLLNYANVNSQIVLEMVNMNGPPIANAGKDVLVDTGEEVTLNGSASSDIDGTIITYYWDFGDGTKGPENEITHTYDSEGTYIVTLTVTDDSGAMDTDTIRVYVVTPREIPEIPEPVDLTAIEQKNSEQDTKLVEKDTKDAEQDKKIENTTSGGDDDSEQVETNKKDINGLQDSVSSLKAVLVGGLIVVLIISLANGYFRMVNVKNEFTKTKDGIVDTVERTIERMKPKEEMKQIQEEKP